jgi:atypical dual specificity phosphatase
MNNFSWLKPGEIAGSAHPGGFQYSPNTDQGELEINLEFISRANIAAIVSVSEVGLNEVVLQRFEFSYLHLSVQDMAAPTIDDVKEFIAFAHEIRQRGVGTLVHCTAGMGRTGTMLACYLLHEGRTCTQAIDEVRHRRPGSIETPPQEALIHQYSDLLNNPLSPKICEN